MFNIASQWAKPSLNLPSLSLSLKHLPSHFPLLKFHQPPGKKKKKGREGWNMKYSYEKTWVPKKGLFFKPVITFHGNKEKLKKNNTSPWFSTPTTFLSRQWISWSDKGLANVILRGPFSGMPGIKKPFLSLSKKKKTEREREAATVGLGTRRRGSQHAISCTCCRMQISMCGKSSRTRLSWRSTEEYWYDNARSFPDTDSRGHWGCSNWPHAKKRVGLTGLWGQP